MAEFFSLKGVKYMKMFSWKFFKFLPDKYYIKLKYFTTFNRFINLKNPQTFNEKIQWLKLNDRKKIYTKMVDKYEAKKIVSNTIGEEFIIPTIGIYDSFEQIDFNKIPQQFVIKCTHDCGSVFVIKNKNEMNFEEIKTIINKKMSNNYYYTSREWPYKNVKPRIIVEKYMGDNLSDYKIHCFNGKAKFILVCTDRKKNLKETFFSPNWEIMPFKRPNHSIDNTIKRPRNLRLMLELAEKLSKNNSFLRVDFYEVNGQLYFGELTFYPSSGFAKFDPEEWDKKIGDFLNIEHIRKE